MTDSQTLFPLSSPFPSDIVWRGEIFSPIPLAQQHNQEQIRTNAIIAGALRDYGLGDVGTLKHLKSGARCWPDEVVGSVSHTRTAVVVAVGSSRCYRSIGVDVEHVGRDFSLDIASRICRPEEVQALHLLSDFESKRIYLLRTFCVKEAFYKALQPLVHHFIGYQDAGAEFSGQGTAVVTLYTDQLVGFRAGSRFTLRLLSEGDYLYAGLIIPREAAPQ